MKIGKIEVKIGDDDTVSWVGPLSVDADGSPFAYVPLGSGLRHLDDLANAGRPGHWFGIMTLNGQADGTPVRQLPTDPNPGGYISTTALVDRSKSEHDPLRYVDAEKIRYISIPLELLHEGVKLGDVARVVNQSNGRMSSAIVADVGPHGKLGEGSPALAIDLGLSGDACHGGTEHPCIAITIYAGSTRGWPRTMEEIAAQVNTKGRTNESDLVCSGDDGSSNSS